MLNWTIQIVNSREFCSLMVKRDHEKETVEDLKQAFRVFDKAGIFCCESNLRACRPWSLSLVISKTIFRNSRRVWPCLICPFLCEIFCCKDGNGYVSTSELKFVMNKLNVHFSEQVMRRVLFRS